MADEVTNSKRWNYFANKNELNLACANMQDCPSNIVEF